MSAPDLVADWSRSPAAPAVARNLRAVLSAIPVGKTVDTFDLATGILATINGANGPRPMMSGSAYRLDFAIFASSSISTVRLAGRGMPRIHSHDEWSLSIELELDVLDGLWSDLVSREQGRPFHLPAHSRNVLAAIRQTARSTPVGQLHVKAKCIDLLVSLLKSDIHTLVPTADATKLSRLDTLRMTQARKFIEKHAARRPSLDEIARECGINRSKLTAAFREIYGCTVGQAMAQARFAVAEELLLASDHQIDRIAFDAGYEDTAAFTRAFGARYGVSPARFRLAGGVLN